MAGLARSLLSFERIVPIPHLIHAPRRGGLGIPGRKRAHRRAPHAVQWRFRARSFFCLPEQRAYLRAGARWRVVERRGRIPPIRNAGWTRAADTPVQADTA